MKFTCECGLFKKALAATTPAALAKSSNPALEGIYVLAEENGVTLRGYNYRTSAETSFPAQVSETGACIINARFIWDIVRSMPDGMVHLTVRDDLNFVIGCGNTELTGVALPAKMFPELPFLKKLTGVTLPAGLLKEMITDVAYAVSENDNHPINTGILFETNGTELILAAVDGYRLSVRRETLKTVPQTDLRFVVPGECIKIVLRNLPDGDEMIGIYPQNQHALFDLGAIRMSTRLLDGEFIDYRTTMSIINAQKVTLPVLPLIRSLEVMSVINNDRVRVPVRFHFKDGYLSISVMSSTSTATDAIPVENCPEDMEIGFNDRYILDALRSVHEDTVVMNVTSPLTPCLFTPEKGNYFAYLVLPVKLKK